MAQLGFIGLGTIGSVIAGHLQAAGHELIVHDIKPTAAEPLVAKGATTVIAPSEVAHNCDVIFSSLPGPREVEQVALGADGLKMALRRGAIYVDLSSSSAELIRKIATTFEPCGVEVIDAPLIVGKQGIANKSVQVLASGSPQAFQRVKPMLDAFSDAVVYTGALGTGTIIKLAHNLVRRGIGLAIGEGLVLGVKAGAEPALLWQCMHWGLEVQLQQMAESFGKTIFNGDFDKPASFGIGLSRKDVALATAMGRQHSVPMPIAALVEQTMIQAVARGWSEQSTASLFRLQEEAAGIEVRKPRG